jgi:5-deoxy-glucuronate isomerase
MGRMSSSLLVHPLQGAVYHEVTPHSAGWELLHFGARRLSRNGVWSHDSGDSEIVIVVLSGRCEVSTASHHWKDVGARENVFAGRPYAVYLPPGTSFELSASSAEVDIAYGWCRAEARFPARLITPEHITTELRGKGNASRQINDVVPPGAACDRLVVVEVYTPSGNWSSYPPHKHDVHREDGRGTVLEADLEEVYFYKIDRPEGFAVQRVYTDDRSLDEVVVARSDDVVLVPEGYHPVSSAHGYTTYYLNFLAGSAHSLANSDDPDHAWVKDTWEAMEIDPRLPVVH